jgi:hypothetical protein
VLDAEGDHRGSDVTFIEGDRNLTVSGNRSTGDGTLVALFKTTGATIAGNTVTGSGCSSAWLKLSSLFLGCH